jgi:hypothetical protein
VPGRSRSSIPNAINAVQQQAVRELWVFERGQALFPWLSFPSTSLL